MKKEIQTIINNFFSLVVIPLPIKEKIYIKDCFSHFELWVSFNIFEQADLHIDNKLKFKGEAKIKRRILSFLSIQKHWKYLVLLLKNDKTANEELEIFLNKLKEENEKKKI